MSQPRFFHAALPASGPVELDADEARHASNVLRLLPGDNVTLFDGLGGEAQGVITASSKRGVQVDIRYRSDTNRELPACLELLIALPKGERQKTLIDGLVQYGVQRLTPLVCSRSVAQPTGSALQRLRRTVLESCKQCGRNQLLELSPPLTIDEVAQQPRSDVDFRWVAHPYGSGQSLLEAQAQLAACRHQRLTAVTQRQAETATAASSAASSRLVAQIAIGPEGGFTDEEMAALTAAGWQTLQLGARILRIEFAALQTAAWWSGLWG